MKFQYTVPSHVIFGEGSSKEVGELVASLGAKKVLLVYDKGVEAVGLLNGVRQSLQDAKIGIVPFDNVIPNPTIEQVEDGAKIARAENVDAVIAVGGGSPMDVAKAINILLTNPSPILQYEGLNQVKNPGKPLIAIPTTAGTSSEVTVVSALVDAEASRKVIIKGRHVEANYAVLDPLLTASLPPSITAATGMDALTHAIESYVSKNASPVTRPSSLEAAKLISEYLPRAVADGKDMEARSNMLLSCVIVGFAFSNGDLGLVHGIAHALSGHFDLAHGMANATVLPYVMEFNAKAVPEDIARLGEAMGLPAASDPKEGAAAAVEYVKKFSREINIPPLRELGVPEDALEMLADETMKEFVLNFNPIMPTKEDVLEMLKKAY